MLDDQPARLLRCNFIMRGVYLLPGEHKITFRFNPPAKMFFVTLVAVITALFLAAYLGFLEWRKRQPEPEPTAR